MIMGEEDLEEEEAKLLEALREKIRSKMEVAKTLAAFFTVLLAALIALSSENENMQKLIDAKQCGLCFFPSLDILSGSYEYMLSAGILMITISIVLFFCTMYEYDRLLMPRKFSTDKHNAQQLYESMIRAWSKLFNIAVAFLILGLVSFVSALVRAGIVEILVLFVCIGGSLYYGAVRAVTDPHD